MRASLFLALALLTVSTGLSQQPNSQATHQSKKALPETREELAVYLIGTSWIVDGDPTKPATFRDRGIFESGRLKPRYLVTGRRSVTIIWSPKTKIPCIISEDCGSMIEMAGERHTFTRL
jgi:hypothetical protein